MNKYLPFLFALASGTAGCSGCEALVDKLKNNPYDELIDAGAKDAGTKVETPDASAPSDAKEDAGMADSSCEKVELQNGVYMGVIEEKMLYYVVGDDNDGKYCAVVNPMDYAVPILVMDYDCNMTPDKYSSADCPAAYDTLEMYLRNLYQRFREDLIKGQRLACPKNKIAENSDFGGKGLKL